MPTGKLRLVLDSNEYIFGFGAFKKAVCESLLNFLKDTSPLHSICVPRLIIEEVRRNIVPVEFKEFVAFIESLADIDEDFVVPFELGSKYEFLELKPGDAFIAAYAEWVGSDILVSENRHFLTRHSNLPFKILNAETCLKLMRAALQ